MDDTSHFISRMLAVVVHTILIFLTSYGMGYFFIRRFMRGFSVKSSLFSCHTLIHSILMIYNFLQTIRGIFGSINSIDSSLDKATINFSTFLYYLKDGCLIIMFFLIMWAIITTLYDTNEKVVKISKIVTICLSVFCICACFLHAIVKVSTNVVQHRSRNVGDAEYHQSDPFFEFVTLSWILVTLVFVFVVGVLVYKRRYNSLRYNITLILLLEVILLFAIHRLSFIIIMFQQSAHLLYELNSVFNRVNGVLLTFIIVLGFLDQDGWIPDDSKDDINIQ